MKRLDVQVGVSVPSKGQQLAARTPLSGFVRDRRVLEEMVNVFGSAVSARRLMAGRHRRVIQKVTGVGASFTVLAALLTVVAPQTPAVAVPAVPAVRPARLPAGDVTAKRVTRELVGLRTAQSRTYALQDGTRRSVFSAEAVKASWREFQRWRGISTS